MYDIQVNLVFLVVALTAAFKSKRRGRNAGRNNANNFKWILGTFSLTFILGITWLYGFLYFSQNSMALAYVFTVLNSIQGLVIFVTFCLLNKQVCNDLRRQMTSSQVSASSNSLGYNG